MTISFRLRPALPLLVIFGAACGSADEPSLTSGSGGSSSSGAPTAAGSGGVGGGASCAGDCTTSAIKHLVVIIQENHTFDNHFGRYCTAPTGSAPACNEGPACCEAGPATEPSGAAPQKLDDAAHGAHDPIHSELCELDELDGGKMDRFVTGMCGHPGNFAYADPAIVAPYWDLASKYALADRYFQPIAGASSSNDMYFARAGYVFTDNRYEPKGSVGSSCESATENSFPEATIGDLLNTAKVSWTFYAEGYKAMADLKGACPTSAPTDCPAGVPAYPCIFDPGDVPFQYYPSLVNNPTTMRDLDAFHADIAHGTLPSVSYLKLLGYKTEHPGAGTKLSAGVAATTTIVDEILASDYRDDTLVLLDYDEGGGYFDHIAPPAASAVDKKAYGTRLPVVAIGPFARKNWVSHVTMEHSSVVRFVEWNWLGGKTGQLGQRDAVVNGIGSLLDPKATGALVP